MDDINAQFSHTRQKLIRMGETPGIRGVRDTLMYNCNELQSDLDYCHRTNQNKDRIRAAFAKSKQHLANTESRIILIMKDLPPYQQYQVISYWEEATRLLTNVFDWIKQKFFEIVERIWSGIKYVASTVSGWIKSTFGFFRNIF